jgi:hypothetical protein
MQHMGMNMQYGHEHAACPNHFIEVEVKSWSLWVMTPSWDVGQQEGVGRQGRTAALGPPVISPPQLLVDLILQPVDSLWQGRFSIRNITDKMSNFLYLVSSRTERSLRLVFDLTENPPVSSCYTVLKDRLRSSHSLANDSLGGWKLLKLLAKMLELCLRDQEASKLSLIGLVVKEGPLQSCPPIHVLLRFYIFFVPLCPSEDCPRCCAIPGGNPLRFDRVC